MSIANEPPSDSSRTPMANFSSADLLRMIDEHPIVMKTYILPTPMLQRTYNLVRERVWARRTGLNFYSTPRIGKTSCLMMIKGMLEAEFPKTFFLLISARSSRPSDAHMFRLLLEGLNHELAGRTNSGVLFRNAVTDIAMQVGRRRGMQFVLLIDEMQLLSGADLGQLLVVHNDLKLKNINMTTLSFAQPEILHRRAAMMIAGERQIIARFLSEPLAFDGCTSVEELKEILKAFDEGTEYPEGSGWSYTRFFLPQAFEQGFRLQTYASRLWSALTAANAGGESSGLPMEHTIAAIESLLQMARASDCANFVLSDSDLEDAVDASQLRSFTTMMQE